MLITLCKIEYNKETPLSLHTSCMLIHDIYINCLIESDCEQLVTMVLSNSNGVI